MTIFIGFVSLYTECLNHCFCALRRTPRLIGGGSVGGRRGLLVVVESDRVLSGVHKETLATVDRCSPNGEPSLPLPPGVFKEINQSSSL